MDLTRTGLEKLKATSVDETGWASKKTGGSALFVRICRISSSLEQDKTETTIRAGMINRHKTLTFLFTLVIIFICISLPHLLHGDESSQELHYKYNDYLQGIVHFLKIPQENYCVPLTLV